MRSKRIRGLSFIMAAGFLLVSFQNCGKAGFDGANEQGLDLNSLNPDSDNDPFAFSAAFDQITYNSCFGTTSYRKPGYFSIKAGAYETGGVRVTQSFMDKVNDGETIKPIWPATTISNEQIKTFLSKSGANVYAQPQMALRTRSNLQQIRSPGGSATEGLDFVTMLGDLTDDRWMHPIIENGPSVSNLFFSFAPESGRRLEAQLSYNQSEKMAEDLRNDLSDSGMLALTFRTRPDLGDATAARTPSGANYSVAYGRGYNLTFGRALAHYTQCIYDASNNCNAPALALYSLGPTNILTDVVEVDLERPNQQVAQWTCEARRRYVVIHPLDKDVCPEDPVLLMNDPNYRREYEIVRRHLSVKDWHVNISLRCVVPKNGGCYDNRLTNSGQRVLIEYDQTKPCYQDLDQYKSQYGSPFPSKMCAQYISVCTR